MSVVSGLGLDRREVVAVVERPATVEPVDPFGGRDLESSRPFHGRRSLTSSVLKSLITDSARVLS